MTLEKKAALPLAAILGCVLSVNAQAIAVGSYNLYNHPDGSENPPAYGLRLDGLLSGNSSEEYTFDFNHQDSAMTLSYDGSTIVIDGTAFGGEDAGSSYVAGTTAVWTIHFEYEVGISSSANGGVDDLIVNANGANFGSISSNLGTIELSDKASSGTSFRFGDKSGNGHRGFDGISGWGWLMHGSDCLGGTDCENIQYSDWLFTASATTPVTAVPVPGALWLFTSSILGLVAVKRRR
ncbi:hypothetical protein [Oceanicoccus sagamiensis]|uniref:PEP-CTERM protein-sorting domain-containing protein n=1 Tax=Oceanicoccus sagamiensis TaxID=716816 RepID=A0A1X9N7X0_9GAMM|nr:hypothetical protein [Oceanicoccus sagamiensis]ARN73271.1 hypothetical protein BST96_03600 [Oceanicoccus sagamiensis]